MQVSRPHSPATETVSALVDSGCDITAVPAALAERLRLRHAGYTLVREVLNGKREMRPVYLASLGLEMGQSGTISVVLWDGDYVLLGRDVLNDWKVTLDGPQGNLDIE